MTKKENESLAIVATDVSWIREEMGRINKHLQDLNTGSIKAMTKLIEHEEKIYNNRSNISRLWMVIGIILTALLALKFTGML